MENWCKILPFFIIRYIALRNCDRIIVEKKTYVNPFPGVLIKVPENIDRPRPYVLREEF
jgi:hypothetical protein